MIDAQEKPSLDSPNLDPEEIARFEAMAGEWWDPSGKFKPLHRLNPVRLGVIRDLAAARFGRDPRDIRCLAGIRILDIGCGGGLVCEPLARLGAEVLGLDASPVNIEIARTHAAVSGLSIDYRAGTAEALVEAGESFDLVLALEIVEHVPDAGAFLTCCAALTAPGGGLVMSTINRTAKAYAFAILGAEYLLRWLPVGTHDWRRFVRPSEAAAALRAAGLTIGKATGLAYNPLTDTWGRSPGDLDVNYMISATKDAAPA
jgi:2-polyprenyl-6-hydroxyphenyl methylase/3-demethylubiquinone-9 3-methyltransferase